MLRRAMASSGAAVPFWRAAGMTYISYSNSCASLVRSCLKEPESPSESPLSLLISAAELLCPTLHLAAIVARSCSNRPRHLPRQLRPAFLGRAIAATRPSSYVETQQLQPSSIVLSVFGQTDNNNVFRGRQSSTVGSLLHVTPGHNTVVYILQPPHQLTPVTARAFTLRMTLPLWFAQRRFCSLDSHESGGLIPPELLRNKIVLRPDSDIGKYADLVTRVTNFHCEDKGLMVLAGDVFDSPIRKDIVQRVVRWQLAKRQQGTHSTKTISEVSGTGRKAYPQKGTGRARHGSLRAPQFRHGATMHGPKPRSHAFKLQKKVRRLGLKIALSARTAEGKVSLWPSFSPPLLPYPLHGLVKLIVFEDLEVPSHKTKNIVNYLAQLENTRKVLLVDGGPIDDKLKLATRNLQYVNVLPSIGLNVYSILLHDTLVMTRDAVSCIVERMHTPINR
ncbi:hypothetical protein ZIOFF_027920 [Zingiber officinale]|uniref:Large ribosomal subunit protein uL4m n=1 Tax=Zingiber officinale TaxID=94328 RepID=A0A8J5GKJ9_ZINOF|nr:hypothetical protein ZIOFF_027920 [Zingiber officinale]